MTGFGRATVDGGAGRGRLRVEIRSVNHRGLDLKTRTPQPDAFCEAEIGRAVRASVERGSVTVHIREESAPARGRLDEARLRQGDPRVAGACGGGALCAALCPARAPRLLSVAGV